MQTIKCPSCGKEISSMANACPACGHPINPVPTPQPQPPQKKKHPVIIAIVIVLIVAIIGFVALMVVSLEYDKSIREKESKNISDITISTEQIERNTNTPTEQKEEHTEAPTEKAESSGLSPEFKQAMDSYENFMDEYISFMKKYKANPTDASLLKEYPTYLSKYNDMMSDFAKWKNNGINKDESKYYLEVQTRVQKKLVDVAQ